MSRVNRFDKSDSLKPPVRMDNGFMRVDGRIARVGVQEYRKPDGSTHRELRLPEEVFNADSMASFHFLPVTNQHPPGMLTARNAKKFQVGSVGESVRQDGDFIAATLMITDEDAIKAVESGRSQLSNGYSCELDETQDPSLIAKWGRYDSIQRNIRGNHVALVDVARAGPAASLRLDASDAIALDYQTMVEDKQMHKFAMDGLTIEVADANQQAIIERSINTHKERADKAEAAISAASARADVAEAKAKDLAAEVEKVKASKVDDFKSLLALAAEVSQFGVDVAKLDHTEAAYKAAAVKQLMPTVNLDGKDAAYVSAVYDVAKTQRPSAVDLARAGQGPNATREDVADNSADAARQRMLKRHAEMCK